MSVFALLSLAAALGWLSVGVYIFSKSPGKRLNLLFLLMCLSAAFRSFVEFGYRQSPSYEAALFWQSIDVFWPLASLFIFHFTFHYAFHSSPEKMRWQRWLMPVVYALSFSIVALEISTDIVSGPPVLGAWGWTFGNGTFAPALYIATGYAFLLILASIGFIIIRLASMKKSPLRAGAIALALFLVFISAVGIVTQIICPLAGIDIPELLNLGAFIGFIPLGYLVLKNRLFDISPERAVDNIITSMRDSLILVSHDGFVKYANPAACELLGYTVKEFENLPVLAVLPPGERALTDILLPAAENALTHTSTLEASLRAQSGVIIPVSLSLSHLVVKNNGGNIGSVCIARDIRERKRREAELAEYRQRLEELVRIRTEKLRENYQRFITLFDESPIALVEVDLTRLQERLAERRGEMRGDIIHFCMTQPLAALRLTRLVEIVKINKALLCLLDIESKADLNRSLSRIFRKKSFGILLNIIEALDRGDNALEAEGIVCRPDGRERCVSIRLSFILDPDLPGSHALLSLLDVTPQKRAEEEKAELEEQLRHVQKMEALGTLAGGIAHDFNNLLAGILGYADLLKSELDPEGPLHRDASVIERTANKAAVLVRQLLNFARKGKQHNIAFDLHLIIDEVITILKHTIDKRIRLVRRFGDPAAHILGDPGQMEQVIINLAVNACDAMPDGGELVFETAVVSPPAKKMIAFPHLSSERYVRLEVRDTGVGVPEEIRDRIFEPFFTTKQAGRGTGMGLAVVYGIIANHEGLIEVEANKPQGTVFRTYLPLVEKHSAPAPIEPAGRDAAGHGRILVVDDEEVVCRVIERMLGREGYSIELARDGEEAIERYSREKDGIDLVLIDMIMPRMNGRDCFRALRKLNPDLRAVLITGHLPEGSAFEAITEGMRDVIFKPFSRGKLTETVRAALRP
jgi:PAS domain S-box-containing protein